MRRDSFVNRAVESATGLPSNNSMWPSTSAGMATVCAPRAYTHSEHTRNGIVSRMALRRGSVLPQHKPAIATLSTADTKAGTRDRLARRRSKMTLVDRGALRQEILPATNPSPKSHRPYRLLGLFGIKGESALPGSRNGCRCRRVWSCSDFG